MAGTTDVAARRLRRVKRACALVLGVVVLLGACAARPRGRIQVFVDGNPISCDVADTPDARMRGLQDYSSLPDGRGMLFVNEAPMPVALQVKRLAFPVDVAFVDQSLNVVKVACLDPEAAREVGTSDAALYVIEAPAGWLAANRIGVGSRVGFLGGQP